jgi:hypothetical protein
MGKDLEESDHGLIEIISLHFLEGLRKFTKNLNQDIRGPGHESNREPMGHELIPLSSVSGESAKSFE